MVLAVTVGVALIRHPLGGLPFASPRHPASGTVAAPPARPPTSGSPSRHARHRTGPGDTVTLQMDASNHRTISAPESGRETIRPDRHGNDAGHGHGNGHGQGNGNGNGQGNGNGHGHGNGQGNGNGHGNGQGNGNGHGQGNGNASVLSVLSQPPGRGSGVAATEPPHHAKKGQLKADS
jgi:hypothetical protein